MTHKITLALLALCTSISVHTANAAEFNFNFTNLGVAGGSINDSVGMSAGGISVDVAAYSLTNDGSTISAKTLLSGTNGIYVSSSTSGNLGVVSAAGNTTDLNGSSSSTGIDEGLQFTFSQLVSLDYINFDSFGSTDDFNLTVDGVTLLVDHDDGVSSPLVTNVLNQSDEYIFNGITGTEFIFWADGGSDDFRIDTLRVSAVPVPAAAWLFMSGLLGLAGISRRKA